MKSNTLNNKVLEICIFVMTIFLNNLQILLKATACKQDLQSFHGSLSFSLQLLENNENKYHCKDQNKNCLACHIKKLISV